VKLDGVKFGLSEKITCLSTKFPARRATDLWNGLAMEIVESKLVTGRGIWERSMDLCK